MADYGIGSWPERRARIDPDKIALAQAERELTYAGLAGRVARLAGALAGCGVGPGDRVAYLGFNDIATFETLFAAGRLGARFVPISTRLTAAELGLLLDDAAPRVLVHGPEQASLVAAADPARHGVGVVIPVAGSGPGGYQPLIAAAGEAAEAAVSLDDDAVILYTSGTTGRPKGAVLTHANLTFNTMNQLAHVDVSRSDVALCSAPLFHAAGLGQVSLPVMFKGGTVVLAPRFDPAWMLAEIGRRRITAFSAVPTMLQMLCDDEGFAAADLSSLRYVIYGGSMAAERVAVAWQRRGVELLQGYGMTEAVPGVCLAVPGQARDKPVSMGVPHFFTDVTLAPVEAGGQHDPAPASSGTVSGGTASGGTAGSGTQPAGELLVRGLNVFRGYWNKPAETARAQAGGWFRSGDVVRLDGGGWGYVVDRISDMFISGGENVYPAEVEGAIGKLPGVADCAVIGFPDQRWGEAGLAFVITTAETSWTEESLRDALRGRLATFKIPKRVRFVDDLPRTPSGKVRKQDLRAAAADWPEASGR
jgi:fatty-acyl-CoA synthase